MVVVTVTQKTFRAASTVLSPAGLTSPPAFYEAFQLSTSSASLVSSTIIAVTVAFFGNVRLSSPYRRIIFGLSISDIIQSFAFITGPSAVPQSRFSAEAGKEITSCKANGFLLLTGGSAVMMYTVFLCLYYLCKLKYRMSDQAFRYKIEEKFHAFIVLFCLIFSSMGLAKDVFHTNPHYRSFCSLAVVPTRCRVQTEIVGECDQAQMVRVMNFVFIINVGLPVLTTLGVVITMGLLYHHAYMLHRNVERQLSIPTSLRNAKAREEDDKMSNSRGEIETPQDPLQRIEEEDSELPNSNEEDKLREEKTETPRDRLHEISRLYRREITIQATCWVLAFSLTYLPIMIISVLAAFYIYPAGFSGLVVFLWPFGGFLNILVYTRPKVAGLRRNHPEISRLRSFWLVLKAGGEIPDEIESTCCNCCNDPAWLDSFYDYSTTRNQKETGVIDLTRIGF